MFEFDISVVQQDIAVVTLTGSIDSADCVTKLEEAIASLFERPQRTVIFDLAAVTYISSTGWGVFIQHSDALSSGRLLMARLRPLVKSVYELLGFGNFQSAYESLEDARMAAEIRATRNGA